jgi:hypothetical protein
MIRAGECTEPGCGARITVSPKTGLIRKHTPRGVVTGKEWCPAGGTEHPIWQMWLADERAKRGRAEGREDPR